MSCIGPRRCTLFCGLRRSVLWTPVESSGLPRREPHAALSHITIRRAVGSHPTPPIQMDEATVGCCFCRLTTDHSSPSLLLRRLRNRLAILPRVRSSKIHARRGVPLRHLPAAHVRRIISEHAYLMPSRSECRAHICRNAVLH